MDLPYYHGPLTKQDCEKVLLKEGVDGNFLLRDSESVSGVLCLCVSFRNVVYTYRIFKDKHGDYSVQTAEGEKKNSYSSLKELVSQYEKPNQGLVIHLIKPIKRTSPCLRWRRSKLELEEPYENKSEVYVNSSSNYVNSSTVYGKSGSIYAKRGNVYANCGSSSAPSADSAQGAQSAQSSSEDVYSNNDYVQVLP
ncbi:PREDICTED: SH2 domain-containing protein 1B [Condylura cristata]|uniref:SH2 domain-containing protein 1B n=1 Tax=Condylura cristata TaxID=143302 RepID=UPI0003345F26|nr:PREDICTED: SH2 domain-containing protein 1B [Condylura cristata]